MNAVGSSSQDRHSAKIPPNISTMPKSFEPMRPHHTSIDMSNPIYDSQLYGSSPQPLIRAIKDELLRLSRSAKGKTEIQDLRTSQDQGHYPFTWSLSSLNRALSSCHEMETCKWKPGLCFPVWQSMPSDAFQSYGLWTQRETFSPKMRHLSNWVRALLLVPRALFIVLSSTCYYNNPFVHLKGKIWPLGTAWIIREWHWPEIS